MAGTRDQRSKGAELAGMRDQRSLDARKSQYPTTLLAIPALLLSLARTGSGSKDQRSLTVDCLHCSYWASREAAEAAVADAVVAPGERSKINKVGGACSSLSFFWSAKDC